MLKKIPFLLLAVVAVVLATATFVEHGSGHDVAVKAVYTSWWMAALWALTVVSALLVMLRQRLYRRPVALLLHLSLAVILVGALVTHLWGEQGSLWLRTGETVGYFTDGETQNASRLPFQLELAHFDLQTYPGTQSPMDYVSQVNIVSHGTPVATLRISMNHVGEYGGYRFYQSGYDRDLQGARLLVSHDPWGIGITYTGYGLLFLSMLLLLVLPREGFRRLLAQSSLLLLAFTPLSSPAQPSSSVLAPSANPIPPATAAHFGDLYVYHNGRICPVQTMARHFTTKLYGKPAYQGLTAEQVLLGFVLNPSAWTAQPIIKVKPAVARLLGTEGRYAAYLDFHGPTGYKLDSLLSAIHAGQEVADARAIIEADEKMNILLMLFSGEMLKLFPCRTAEGQVTWFAPASTLPKDLPEDQYMFIRKSMDYVGELAYVADYKQLDDVLTKIRAYQQKEAEGLLPSDRLFRAEKLYNAADHTRPLAMLLLTLGLVAFVLYLVFWLRQEASLSSSMLAPSASPSVTGNPLVTESPIPRWLSLTTTAVLLAATTYLLFIVALRGYVSGHLPLSNGFETMQFMALCSLVITLLAQRRFLLLPPFGLLLAGLTLLVAMMGEQNPQITPLMPVLASPLLSLHVCIIMVAYSLLAFILLNALTALMLNGRKHEHQVALLTRMSHLMLYPAVFCLAAGIFIGAIWANQSWGRYWGWDPKEVWALITLLVYSIPLHRQSLAWLRRPRWFHLYMALAFLSILMTYFGVNFFLGGMHSYA